MRTYQQTTSRLCREQRMMTLKVIAKNVRRTVLVEIISSLLSSEDNPELTETEQSAGMAAFQDLIEIGNEIYPGFDPAVESMQD